MPASRADAERATVPMALQRVADGVYFVQGESAMGSALNQGFVSNAGVVVSDDGVLVIDALGTPALARRLIEEIAKVTTQPVRTVVVTHYHADHIYGLQAFREAGARIVAHVGARGYIGSDTARLRLQASRDELFPWIDERTQVVEPDQWVDSDLTLTLGSTTVQVRHVGPAHTTEDLAVVLPAAGVVFAGDLVFRGRTPFVGQADSGRWIESLDQLIAARPRVVVPGHGPAATDPERDVALTRDYLKHLRDTMGRAARDLEPFDDAYAKTDWSRFEAMPLFKQVNRMNAYNTYLLMEAQATK
jgi:glyoxylase-like metal-dependent hydrolase (beta-lactamase superfamily II)